jgi:hypothetical protein
MVKLPLVSLHPVGVPLPTRVHVPVIERPLRVVALDAVPVTVPLRVRVLPPDCTTNKRVPVTESFEVMVKGIDPVGVSPEKGKHCPAFEFRN